MASSATPSVEITSSAQISSQVNVSNLESFTCIWVDQNINSTQDNQDTQQALRRVINHLRTFDNITDCEQCIRQTSQEKVVLIVSGRLGEKIVRRIHDLLQLSACYVFCQDKKTNEKWAKKYPKIKGVFIERAKLIAQISEDQIVRTKIEDGASISVIHSSTQSLQARNAIFMWFQLFIEVLLRMHHRSSDRKELIAKCKTIYKGNDHELLIIDDFEKNYKAENAIWWYTRESCFYRMMNKALRVQDFDMLFAFRFFITDIAKQIKNDYKQNLRTNLNRAVFRVYRGQVIATDELELMKSSYGEFLSMNSFLSTTRKHSNALHFAQQTPVTNGYKQIIFEIEIDLCSQTKEFADITKTSYFQNEKEILIILGALFRIGRVTEDTKNHVWTARLSLANEDDFPMKETFAYMKRTIEDDTDLDSLGKILFEMGEYYPSQKYYERLMDDLQVKISNCHMGLGKAKYWQKNGNSSLDHYNQALRIRQDKFDSNYSSIGEVYTYIGIVYWHDLKDYDQALRNLEKAIVIQEQAYPRDNLLLSISYNNLAATYDCLGEYELAKKYYDKCLTIQKEFVPTNHPRTATTYYNLGALYAVQLKSTEALQYYEKSLSIRQKCLPPEHKDLIETEKKICETKESRKILIEL